MFNFLRRSAPNVLAFATCCIVTQSASSPLVAFIDNDLNVLVEYELSDPDELESYLDANGFTLTNTDYVFSIVTAQFVR